MERDKPGVSRFSKGPENISGMMRRWTDDCGIRFEYLQPRKPQQNACMEWFNWTVRYEWLCKYHWRDLDEVRLYATNWLWLYYHERPDTALGDITSKQRLTMIA